MRYLGFLVLILLPMMGFAQNVKVRSGDHVDFSRLAFEFVEPVVWEMGRVKQGYEIRLRNNSSTIDLSEVYDRISHDRITSMSVSKDNSRITLGLECDCHADAFEFRPGLLVVDIKDGKPSATSRFETVFNSGELAAEQFVTVEEVEPPALQTSESPKAVAAVTLPLMLPNVHAPTKPNVGVFAQGSKSENVVPAGRVSEMQDKIVQQIGRAASQGLLNANLSHPNVKPQSTHDVPREIAPSITTKTAKPSVNIHIQSSIDREFSNVAGQRRITGDGSECLPDSLFDIANWGDEDSILARASKQRALVLGEFDTVEKEQVERLAKAYIYAGFGAEALEVISAFNLMTNNENILMSMAEMVDGKVPTHHAAFSGQAGCDSVSALWAVFFSPNLSTLDEVNSAAVLNGFSGLPVHLRRLLGPGLAEKFLVLGDVGTARGLRNAIARTDGDSGSEFQMLEAKLDLERGRDKPAQQVLENILVSDHELAPKALIELLEIKLGNEEEVSSKILATAESYIFEQQGTRIAADLKRLIALSLGQSGNFLEALHVLNELEDFEAMDVRLKVLAWQKTVERLAREAPEEVLLKFLFEAKSELERQEISHSVRRELAIRLLSEGWPEQAILVLAPPEAPTVEDRLILSKAEVLKGNNDLALQIIEDIEGDKAAKVRALAYQKSGNHLAAAEEFLGLADVENQKSSTWRAKDWKQLAATGSRADKAAASIMLSHSMGKTEGAPGEIGVMAKDSSLLSKSETERQSIELLLKGYPRLAKEGA